MHAFWLVLTYDLSKRSLFQTIDFVKLRVNANLCYEGLVAVLTLKGHITLKRTELFFSLFQTLPHFGFLWGILLRYAPSSFV